MDKPTLARMDMIGACTAYYTIHFALPLVGGLSTMGLAGLASLPTDAREFAGLRRYAAGVRDWGGAADARSAATREPRQSGIACYYDLSTD